MTTSTIVQYLLTSLVAGVLGGVAMEVVMWLIGRIAGAKGNMILALGSLLTRSRDSGYRVGLIVHVCAAAAFGFGYTLLLLKLGATELPKSLGLGLGVGVAHGLIVSLGLVWVVSDRHPLKEFQGADFLVGLSHLAAHVAFGAVAGLVVGVSPL